MIVCVHVCVCVCVCGWVGGWGEVEGGSKQIHTYHTVPWQMTLVPTGNKQMGWRLGWFVGRLEVSKNTCKDLEKPYIM